MEQLVSFQVGSKILRGVLHTPDKSCSGSSAVVICHGFIGNKIGMHRIFVKAARTFCDAGYIVLRFDFSGCGDSDGDHSEITIDGQVNETLAAIEFLRQSNSQIDKVFLIGHSMGGAVAALTAETVEDLTGLVMWAPVAKMYDDILGIVGHRIFDSVWNSGTENYMGFELGARFLKSLQQNRPLQAVQNFSGPVLIIHGTGDEEISFKNVSLYKETRIRVLLNSDFHLVMGADHTFSNPSWEEEVFRVTLNWIENCKKNCGNVSKNQSSLPGKIGYDKKDLVESIYVPFTEE